MRLPMLNRTQLINLKCGRRRTSNGRPQAGVGRSASREARIMESKPFEPRMQSDIGGFTVSEALKWRAWGGFVADIWDVHCTPEARGTYLSPDARLFVPLVLEGNGAFHILSAEERPLCTHDTAYTMSYIPADHPIHGEARGLTRIKHLDLHLSEVSVRRRFGRALRRDDLAEPRFGLNDPRMIALAGLLAEALEAEMPASDLYLDGLANALLALLFGLQADAGKRRPALSRAQLRTAREYIEAHCLEPIRLAELAALVGLSETYFSHAFKAAAGVSPHRWVMQTRIREAQDLLRNTDLPVSAVAAECGFSDQAHFNRVFRSVTGTTPGSWRREQRA